MPTRTSQLLERLDAATPRDTLAQPIKQLPGYKSHDAELPPWELALMLKHQHGYRRVRYSTA